MLVKAKSSGISWFCLTTGAFALGWLGMAEPQARAQCQPACGKQNIECFNPGPIYDNRSPVGRVTTVGGGCCTGWVIASPDLIMTNRHCITTNGSANGPIGDVTTMNIIMNLECTQCVGGVQKATTTFNVIQLIQESVGLDYAILRVNGNIAAAFGQCTVDANPPVVGEGVYEIHHAGCQVKGIDEGIVTGGVGPNLCLNGTIAEFPFDAIATGGASGSPIFRSSNHCVMGICHCGPNCAPGFGIPMSEILPNAGPAIQAAGGTLIVCDFPSCPAAGSCFSAHANAGCDIASCCAAVCGVDPFCCENQWDNICANQAILMCSCGGGLAGDCFTPHDLPGCDIAECCDAVCAADPFCCNVSWDSLCVSGAQTICNNCGGAGSGDCFTAHPQSACNIAECCDAVCAVDPFCCDTSWDSICANEAVSICDTCGGTGAGDCFTPHPQSSCNIAECCNAVCAADPFCCDTSWDQLCADGAATICGTCGGAGAGDCFTSHPQAACNIAECCDAVCAADPFCCDVSWDSLCASGAQSICGECGGAGSGSCFAEHPQTACNIGECCDAVCAADPFCCDTFWDSLCVSGAVTLCDTCGGAGAGDCFTPHVQSACNNADCCNEVCAIDPFCCDVTWDSICAGEATKLCESCPGDIAPAGGNGVVNVDDLLLVINSWGPCAGCPADVVVNGIVNVDDLLVVINNWGPCN